jgi:hypothetical protein
MTKEHIEKVIRNNRAGYAAHQLFKEFEAAQQPLVDALNRISTCGDSTEHQIARDALAKAEPRSTRVKEGK